MIMIGQCLCPSRHCIMAVAVDDEPAVAEEKLRGAVADLLKSGAINPWCGLCGSKDFHYEIGVTRFKDMEEARPEFERLGRENDETRRAFNEAGLSYDARRAQNN